MRRDVLPVDVRVSKSLCIELPHRPRYKDGQGSQNEGSERGTRDKASPRQKTYDYPSNSYAYIGNYYRKGD